MRFSVARTAQGPRVVAQRSQSDAAVITGWSDLGVALSEGLLDGALPGGLPRVDPGTLDLGPAVGDPRKIICIGHNYRRHIEEMGHGLPDAPNVFTKFSEALIGPADDISLDSASQAWDWEAELALVIGAPARRVTQADAPSRVAGYTVANDISARDWQRKASQWVVGKTFEATNPIGPWIVTPDEVDPGDGLAISCSVDGVEKQRSTTSDLLFDPAFLISYLSTVLTLRPGDVILTGTPAGVGAARTPPEFLLPGQVVVTEIEGIGRMTNRCAAAGADNS